MAIAYQYTKSGYYAGRVEDYGILPHNATYTAPPDATTGHVLRWTGSDWEQVEDHKGKHGYVNGEPYTINDYGPLPEGWSDTPPPPTEEELFTQLRAARDAKLTATDKYLLPDYPVNADSLAAVKAYRQTLRDLPGQEGAPWDGGGELTPWPELPAVQGV